MTSPARQPGREVGQGNRPAVSTFQSGQDSNSQEGKAFSGCSKRDLRLAWAHPSLQGNPRRVQEPDLGVQLTPLPLPRAQARLPLPRAGMAPRPVQHQVERAGGSRSICRRTQGARAVRAGPPGKQERPRLGLSTAAALRLLDRPVHPGAADLPSQAAQLGG